MEYVEYKTAKIFNETLKKINKIRATQHKKPYENIHAYVNFIPFQEYYKNHVTDEQKDYHRNFWTQRQIDWSKAASLKRKDLHAAREH